MTEVAVFLAGAGAAVLAAVPAAVSLVAVARFALRRGERLQRECDEWRQAAANASASARVMEFRLADSVPDLDDDDASGDNWKHGG